jgi:hypothetical protein
MRAIHRAARARRGVGSVIAAAAVPVGVVAVLVSVRAAPADAHERREVGDLVFVVGWGDEPAFTGFKNHVQVILSDTSDQPIREGVELNAEVTFGEEEEPVEPVEVELTPRFGEEFGEPGDYGADLIPTRPGVYTFRVFGTVNGQEVDESFTSGEETFDSPREPTEVQYPVSDPSTAQLEERLNRELARMEEHDDSGGVEAGTVLGIIGIVLAVTAIAGAGVALRRARARS